MTRALVFLALVFAAALGVTWFAERPGTLTIVWLDTEIRLSLMAAIVAAVVGFGLLWLVYAAIRGALRSPRAVSGYFASRRRDRGYAALSRGIIAVGAGDQRLADRHAGEAARLLHGEPLTVLLRAQAAQLGGDQEAARSAYESMLADPETRLLGLHGLFAEARRLDDPVAARHFAEGAVAIRPGIAWAGPALFAYQAAAGEWAAALATLASNLSNNLVDARAGRRLEAVLRTARGGELEAAEPEVAHAMALEAHRLAPELVPGALLAARLSIRLGEVRRATRILTTTWRLAPHPDLALAFGDLRPADDFRERAKRLRRLAASGGQAVVALTLARMAIDARAWSEARVALAPIVAADPSEAACLLMAEIEEGEHADFGRTRDWLARSLKAPRDPAWVAEGEVYEAWAPIAPQSGRLDAFEWRVPPARHLRNSGAFSAVLAGNGSPFQQVPSGGDTLDIEPAAEETIVIPGITLATVSEVPPQAAPDRPVSAPAGSEVPIVAPAAPAFSAALSEPAALDAAPPAAGSEPSPARPPAGRGNGAAETQIVLPLPDDPGPGGEGEEKEQVPRLFGFLR